MGDYGGRGGGDSVSNQNLLFCAVPAAPWAKQWARDSSLGLRNLTVFVTASVASRHLSVFSLIRSRIALHHAVACEPVVTRSGLPCHRLCCCPKPTWIQALHSYCGSWLLQVSAQLVCGLRGYTCGTRCGHPTCTCLCSAAGIVAWAMAYGIGANGESGCLAGASRLAHP